MKLKVYVAGSSAHLEECERVMNNIRALGDDITHDWVAMIRYVGSANSSLSARERSIAAEAAMRGIDEADVVVLATPLALSRGMMFEFGYAVAKGKPVLMEGEFVREFQELTVFSECAQ